MDISNKYCNKIHEIPFDIQSYIGLNNLLY